VEFPAVVRYGERFRQSNSFAEWSSLVLFPAGSRRHFLMPWAVGGKEHTTPFKRSAHPANLATNQAKGMALPTIAC